jgi:RNA polymerase sigma factor (sigma-70 family)
MAHSTFDVVLRRLRRLVGAPADGLSDHALLERFASVQDEAAFETLVRRHGPMVLAVCRRVLGDSHAAEDAFQATFLVLVRKAGMLRRQGSLAGWLYTVARHAALRARTDAQRRRERERHATPRPPEPEPDLGWGELRPVLDEEINRLPDKFRAPLVLCYLEGLTNEEAAQQLGCAKGTVQSRLARARARLRGRLTRRGVTLSTAALTGLLAAGTAAASPPALLVTATRQAGALLAGTPAAGPATAAAALMQGVVRDLFWVKLKVVLAVLLTAGLIGACTALTWTGSPTAAALGEGPPAAADKPAREQALFEDYTAASGIRFTYRNGEEAGHYAILETLGGGIALIDYDGDGLLDIFVVGGGSFDRTDEEYRKDPTKPPRILGRPCKLYRNLGHLKFQDVTNQAGLSGIAFYTHGAEVVDFDRDGWPDLLVTGYGRVALFKNVPDGKGGRRFQDVTREAGLAGKGAGALAEHFWATSAAWGDLDGDGYPDLYICQYVDWSWENNPPCGGYGDGKRDVCPPKQFSARPHALYRNDGRGHFVDVTAEAGLRQDRLDKEYGKGTGVVLVDINGDGRPDIFVAGDTSDNLLYLNRSTPGKMRFDDLGLESGVARNAVGIPNGSMGVDAGDPYGSGRPGLWVTAYVNEMPVLFRNDFRGGQAIFRDASAQAGIAALGQSFAGFGTGFFDLDNDGWEDLVIATGHVIRHPKTGDLQQQPVLLRNLGGGRFEVVTPRGGPYFRARHRGRGLAVGDLDNDGRADLVISNLNEPVVVLRNVAATGHHWLGIELAGKGHADVVGAKLTLEVSGRTLTRFARGGGSFLSSGDRRLLFGLGTAGKVGRLTVEWPSGTPRTEHWDNLRVDRYHRLGQGQGR